LMVSMPSAAALTSLKQRMANHSLEGMKMAIRLG
jgi:hypothetical protein